MPSKPIVVTAGEPAGIGPELVVHLPRLIPEIPLLVIGDINLLREAVQRQGLPTLIQEGWPDSAVQDRLYCLHTPLQQPVTPGQARPDNAEYVLSTIRSAVELNLSGRVHAMVTAPIHKGIINDAGIPFSGHTEFLAELAGCEQVVMMLACEAFRVALATTHLPLRAVADAIDQPLLRSTLNILFAELSKRFGITQPRVQVLGLNPHAGEGGHMGHEDSAIIEPVIQQFAADGFSICGPLPADTAFVPEKLSNSDATLAMYHDQGLPVLKYAGFGNAVNITLGLPFIRTSVDHGTALDIAGLGKADPGSLLAAIQTAWKMQA